MDNETAKRVATSAREIILPIFGILYSSFYEYSYSKGITDKDLFIEKFKDFQEGLGGLTFTIYDEYTESAYYVSDIQLNVTKLDRLNETFKSYIFDIQIYDIVLDEVCISAGKIPDITFNKFTDAIDSINVNGVTNCNITNDILQDIMFIHKIDGVDYDIVKMDIEDYCAIFNFHEAMKFTLKFFIFEKIAELSRRFISNTKAIFYPEDTLSISLFTKMVASQLITTISRITYCGEQKTLAINYVTKLKFKVPNKSEKATLLRFKQIDPIIEENRAFIFDYKDIPEITLTTAVVVKY